MPNALPIDYPKTALCGCGALKVTAHSPPKEIHACACTDCQRGTGTAFSYCAFFQKSDVTVSGSTKSWRRSSQAGRWQESTFCPECGVTVFARLEVIPDLIGISVGCFTDPAFPPPDKLFWSSRSHHWLELPPSIGRVDTQ